MKAQPKSFREKYFRDEETARNTIVTVAVAVSLVGFCLSIVGLLLK